jgi:hypothetical protein
VANYTLRENQSEKVPEAGAGRFLGGNDPPGARIHFFVDTVAVFPIINKYLRVFCLTAKAVRRLNSWSEEI